MNTPTAPDNQLVAPLTLDAVLNSLRQEVRPTVTGEGDEADADRLALAGLWEEAIAIYSRLDVDKRDIREKLAYCKLCCDQHIGLELMGEGIEEASIDGLYLHLCAISEFAQDSGFDEKNYERVLLVYDRAHHSDLPLSHKIELMSQCLLVACLMMPRWNGGDVRAVIRAFLLVACEEMRELGAKNFPLLMAFFFQMKQYRSTLFDEDVPDTEKAETKAEIKALLGQIDLEKCAVLSIPYQAATILQDAAVQLSVVRELCRRYSENPRLEPTISNIAVSAQSTEPLQYLPEELREKAYARPEIQLLQIIEAGDSSAILQGVARVAQIDSYDPLPTTRGITESFFYYPVFYRENPWPTMYCWEASFANSLIEALSPGADRKKYLREIYGFAGDDLSIEVLKELAELLEESPSYNDFLSFPCACLQYVEPGKIAGFIVKQCLECPDDGLYFEDAEQEWIRFLPAIREEMLNLDAERREQVEACLEAWDVPLRPSLKSRLSGASLPEAVRSALSTLEQSVQELGPEHLPYLQHALGKIASSIPGKIAPDDANRVLIQAYNDMIKPRYLTEHGEKRMKALTKRYGPAGVLAGIEALMEATPVEE